MNVIWGAGMYKNRNGERNNIAGVAIRKLRLGQKPFMSQRALSAKLQLEGIDLDKNAIQRIEAGNRFITDIELLAFAKAFNVEIAAFFDDATSDD